MNCVARLLVLLMVIFTDMFPHSETQPQHSKKMALRCISHIEIEKQSHCIEQMVFRKSLVKAFLMTGATIGTLLYGYRWITNRVSEQSPIQIDGIAGQTDTFKSGETASWFSWFVEYIVCRASCYLVIKYASDYAFYKDSISWYLKQHVPYKKTIVLLTDYMKLAQLELANANNQVTLDFYYQSIHVLIQDVIAHCVCMSAYIHYKSQEEKEAKKNRCLLMVEHIIKQVNKRIEYINTLDFCTSDAYGVLQGELQDLLQLIECEVNHAQLLKI